MTLTKLLPVAVLLLSGCAAAPRMPADVALVPDDCANQASISRYLGQVAQTPKSQFATREAYDQHISSVKTRLWTLRYRCNPV